MEEPQSKIDRGNQEHEAGPAKGEVIRAGSDAAAGQNLTRDIAGDSGDAGPASGSGPTVAGTIRRVGRKALDGAEAASRQAFEDAEAAGRKALDGAEAAAQVGEIAAHGAGGQVLWEWASCAQRAYARNTRALGELFSCSTVYGLLQWQSNLLNETLADLTDTNTRILRLVSHRA